MKLSRFFQNFRSAYDAELDDLRTDSEGKDVLKSRLMQKRAQVPLLMSMIQCNPEMVAVAFHGGIKFRKAAVMDALVQKEANKFPTWAWLSSALILEPWAAKLADAVLEDSAGEEFLIVVAGLEYLNQGGGAFSKQTASAEQDEDEGNEEHEERDESGLSDEGEDNPYDLDEAGADWLADQGFDRK
ncbi:MAG: hypothetical protein V4805_13615 [Pseudomonadota bacterium]